ncbi:MAG: AEC family transporter [Ignavibacterium sp.]|jgi:predicted permease|nr:AEC family transporter [Ignavibacterium sp.]
MFDNIVFTANIVAPVFLIIAVGYLARKLKIINEAFVDVTAKFVFQISLPVFVFLEIARLDMTQVFDADQIIFIILGTILTYIIIWLGTIPFIKRPEDKSAFIQGAFRGNYAIVGLAIISNLFSAEALGKATLVLAFLLPVYNILAVIVLTVPKHQGKIKMRAITLEILLNPLILAFLVSLPISFFKLKLPALLESTGNYFAELALPLALVGIGGSLNLENLKKASTLAFTASTIKIILLPSILTLIAYFYGYRGNDLGILFIVFGCPTAIASFVMADAMGANSKLAGNIIMITTLGSVFTISAGILILKSFSLI